MNCVQLAGRLGQDPELKYTTNGKAVANASLATDESYTDSSGEKQKRTEWHRLVFWGKTAEIAAKYLKKGFQTAVEGRIQSRQWEDKDGTKRTSFEIVVNRLHFLSGNPKVEEAAAATQGVEPSTITDDDIPF
jgi:single-strand DNA-binding protein